MGHPTDQVALSADETIAAVSTPTGEGGIGIIRISGISAITIGCLLFRRADGKPLERPQSHRQYYGWIADPRTGDPIDEVLFCVMRAPRSYTCEDVVEISGHGGVAPLQAILRLCLSYGARLATPGEFTRRAFLHGRLDLTQAEAVLNTIQARTEAGLRVAQRQLQGEVGQIVSALRERLITLLASLEASIDFADEDLAFLTRDEIHHEVCEIAGEIDLLIASYHAGRLLREGAQVTIIGRPNTGKSSLLNALLGESRAIVTDIPGTTRDTIEAECNLEGLPLRIIDTAGIHPTEDQIEKIGIERSHLSSAQADLLLLVLDGASFLTAEDITLLDMVRERSVVIVINKNDLPPAIDEVVLLAQTGNARIVHLSATRGSGIRELRQQMSAMLLGSALLLETPMLVNLRQWEAAQSAASALVRCLETMKEGGTEELLAVDLMTAASALGEITGVAISEEIINELFARFCLGK